MHYSSPKTGWTVRLLISSVVLLVCFGGAPRSSYASIFVIDRGWDLFQTVSGTHPSGFGTTFDPDGIGPVAPIPLQGVPLGSFDFATGMDGDFGRGIGALAGLGLTDTIVKRLDRAMGANMCGFATDLVRLEMVALQLMSVAPVDLGGGTDFHFITLQSDRGVNPTDPTPGPASTGFMEIFFSDEFHGEFDSALTIPFDVRIGSLDGPIVASDTITAQSDDNPWRNFPPASELLISGVNHILNGVNEEDDFWPTHLPFGPHVDCAPPNDRGTIPGVIGPIPGAPFLPDDPVGTPPFPGIPGVPDLTYPEAHANHVIQTAQALGPGPHVIPEPTALMIWSLLLAVVGATVRSRQPRTRNATSSAGSYAGRTTF